MNGIKKEDKITIVGAGLTGSLLGIFLARRGFQVDIFEKRPDMRRENISAGRSINLAISERGLHALEQVQLKEKILEKAIPMRGRQMHSKEGELSFQPYSANDDEYINSISRADLNITLMNEAEKYDNLSITFNKEVKGYNHKTNALELVDTKNGESQTLSCDILFGTDGSASAVRDGVLQSNPGNEFSRDALSHSYKELAILPNEDNNNLFKIEKNALHIWPRESFMLIALPNHDGSFTVTLFLANEGKPSFESLKDINAVREFFNSEFSDAVPVIDNLEEDFFNNPTGALATIKCGPWNNGGKALILGDAAHGVVPFYGQGMNACFEDCVILEEHIDKFGTQGWDTVFSEFYKARKKDGDAIGDLAVANFIEMRDWVGKPEFLFEKEIERKLTDWFPDEYTSVYRMVSFSRKPYSVAWDRRQREKKMLEDLRKEINGDISLLTNDIAAKYLKQL